MTLQDEVGTYCPYCGEPITLLVDLSAGDQHYIEDCEVCCRPMAVSVTIDSDGSASVTLRDENSPG
ncbi:CPXCG motif-containing cysteine-rich protein [Microbulbifer sp. SAOS-129_SWC]|uniref:CPXCG motif-containing cysteine-rich protein n=1 Tax=Microbulbifer sp. SAOS-129_SWC TaxID=3145235 RepID=UPI003216630F